MLHWEIEELACKACGLSEEETDEAINNGTIDDLLYDKYEICFEQYVKIVTDLIKFTLPAEAALTDETYQGFVNLETNSFIVKKKM